ncbi:MAG TPA: sulfotransferase [Allosphingosinicella sp.]
MSDAASRIVDLVRRGDLAAAEALGHSALSERPGDIEARVALANLKAMKGDVAGAEALCTTDAPELLRLRGYLLLSQGRAGEAAGCYERIVEADPSDWEIWNNLGNARSAAGDLSGAVDALGRARRLRPDLAPIQFNYATCLAAAGRLEESLEPYAQAARLEPGNPAPALALGKLLRHLGRNREAIEPLGDAARLARREAEAQVELGRAHAGLAELDAAEAAYREALRRQPGLAIAFLELGIVLERGNRIEGLGPLLGEARAQGVPAGDLAYLDALRLRDEGRIDEALEAARRAPAQFEPGRRALLIGKLADRAGDSEAAFEAFREANAIAAAEPAAAGADAAGFRRRVEALTDLVSPGWAAGWVPAGPAERAPPAFLVGFPRSGTTLLDTVLMGHKSIEILEEEPILERVGDKLGGFERLPGLGADEIASLRALYFEQMDRLLPEAAGSTVIDKLPLNLLAAPLIHRLFPDASIVFAQRHPCDVVLSCFMQGFELNDAMANFLDLGDSARLYDLVLGFWEKCRDSLPLKVHVVRYEALVEDVESEARSLLDFLALPWDPAVLDHQRTAQARGTISTPSYSQVIQPIYRESSGRWERYREQMAPVLPILAPWALRLGYGDILQPER